jgi:hypothetical protein
MTFKNFKKSDKKTKTEYNGAVGQISKISTTSHRGAE